MPLTAKAELEKVIKADLQRLGWSHEESSAYLTAQQTHGCLRPGLQSWEYRAAKRGWKHTRPKGRPLKKLL